MTECYLQGYFIRLLIQIINLNFVKGHCALPFNKRNVEIFLYGSELSDNSIEPMDLYIYRLAEYKSIRIGMVSRILKENAADCLLNQNQQKLNASNMQKETQLILSDSKKINFIII